MTTTNRIAGPQRSRTKHHALAAAAAAAMLAGGTVTTAQASLPLLYWDVNAHLAGAGSATPGGTWNAAWQFWSVHPLGDGATKAWVPGGTAVFAAGGDATGSYAIAVDGTQSVGGLLLEEGSVALNGGALSLTPGTQVSAAAGTTLTIASTLTGPGGLDVGGAGSGTVVLSGPNDYAGGTTLRDGTFTVTTDGTLPTWTPLTVDGGTLHLHRWLVEASSLSGSSSAATINLHSSTLVTGGTTDTTYGGVLTGAGRLVKRGPGHLTLTNAGSALTGSIHLEQGTLTSTGSLSVSGEGESVTIYNAALNVTAGTLASSGTTFVGRGDSNGTLLVSGPSTTYGTPTGAILVAFENGAQGTLNVSGGATLFSSIAQIGNGGSVRGDATLTGAGTTWTNLANQFFVGIDGIGTLTVADGARLTTLFSGIGLGPAGNGTVTLAGVGTVWSNPDHEIAIGVNGGLGTVALASAASVTTGHLVAGVVRGSRGVLSVSGAGTSFTSTGGFDIGAQGGTGTVQISGGGKVSVGGSRVAVDAGSHGSVTVTGPGSQFQVLGGPVIGANGTGSLSVLGSGSVVTPGAIVGDTNNGFGSGVVLVDGPGSIWSATGGGLVIGNQTGATGTVTVTNGGSLSTEHLTVGNGGASGQFDVTAGGGATVISANVATNSPGSTGAVTVSGGGSALSITDALNIGGDYWIPGGAGTMNVQSGAAVTVGGGVRVWDTPGAALDVDGGSLSAANLVLSGPNSTLSVTGGAVVLGAADVSAGNISATGGQIEINTGIFTAGTQVIGSTFVNRGAVAGPTAPGASLTFAGAVTGAGSYSGAVTFAGPFSPGDSTAAVSVGDAVFASTSTLTLELAGTTPGTGHDQLLFNGLGTLGGTLDISLVGAFAPAAGDSFDLFAGSFSGTFDAVNLPSLSGGLTWDTSDLYSVGVITAVDPGNLPKTLSWAGPVSGAFADAARWSPAASPAAQDTLVFNTDAPTPYTVTLAAGAATAKTVIVYDDRLTLDLGGHALTASDENFYGLYVGVFAGDDAALTVANGTLVAQQVSVAGPWAGSTGVLIVDGATLDLTLGQYPMLSVGGGGTGTLNVAGGGRVNVAGPTASGLYLGADTRSGTSGTGSAVITGAGSALHMPDAPLVAGYYTGTGSLTVSAGATATVGAMSLGDTAGSTGSALLTGAGSALTARTLNVGRAGAGSVTVSAGATLSSGRSYIAADPGSTGQVIVDGPSSRWLLPAGANNALFVGSAGGPGVGGGGAGSLSILNGALVDQHSDGGEASTFISGPDAASPGAILVDGAGSRLNVGGAIYVGWTGPGTLTLRNGGSATVDASSGGPAPSADTLTVGGWGYLGGAGTIHGRVVSSGIVGPGTWGLAYDIPGAFASRTLTVDGDYTQTADGSFTAYTYGAGSPNNTRLVVSGHAALAGSLGILPGTGHTIADGESLVVLSASSISGTFEDVYLGFEYDEFRPALSYSPTAVTATVHYRGLHWAAAVDGSFHDPSRWSESAAPSPVSIPVFDTPGATPYTVTLAADQVVDSLTVRTGNVTLDLGGHTLTTTRFDRQTRGELSIGEYDSTGISLTVRNGSLNLPHARLFHWPGSTLNIGAGANVTFGYQVLLDGPLNVTGGGRLFLPGTDTTNPLGTTGLGMAHIDEGSLLVSGPGSAVYAAGPVNAGRTANLTGTLRVEAGAVVHSAANTYPDAFDTTVSGTIGRAAGSTGTATVTGAGSAWTQTASLVVSYGGNGTLKIENAGHVRSAAGIVARNTSSVGSVLITGPGSSWQVDGPLSLGGRPGFPGGTASVSLSSGGSLTVAGDLGLSPSATLVVGAGSAVSVGGALANAGRIDIAGGSVTLAKVAGFDPAPLIAQLSAAHNGGQWNGAGTTLLSSTAAADPTDRTAVGYFDGAEGFVLRSTWYGDADGDGTVGPDDYVRLDRGYAMGLAGWQNGDFDYSGSITPADYLLIDRVFVQQGGPMSPEFLAVREAQFGPTYVAALVASVPEPGVLALTGLGLLMINRPFRRSRRTETARRVTPIAYP